MEPPGPFTILLAPDSDEHVMLGTIQEKEHVMNGLHVLLVKRSTSSAERTYSVAARRSRFSREDHTRPLESFLTGFVELP